MELDMIGALGASEQFAKKGKYFDSERCAMCVFRSRGPQITVMMGQSRSEATLVVFCLSDPTHMNQEEPK